MSFLLDAYSGATDAELRMPGCVGSTEYISHTPGKNLTKSRVAHVHELGKVIVANFEDSAGNAKGGKAAGIGDATYVLGQFRALGAPKGIAAYFSVDYEIHSGFATVEAYFQGIRSVLIPAGYLVGGYGDYDLIVDLLGKKLVEFAWQTAAWSYGKRESKAVLYQDQFTQAYDVDELNATYYGAWTPTGAQKPPATPPKEFTVDADAKARFDAVDKEIAAFRDAQQKQTQSLAVIEVWGDPKHPNNLNSIGKRLDAIEKSLAALAAKK